MSYYIRSLEQARAIITAYERCSSCDACPLHTPEGWRCSYLHDCATRYISAMPKMEKKPSKPKRRPLRGARPPGIASRR